MKKRIGIDARLYRESGVGRYLKNLITRIAEIDKENEYFIFLLKKDLNQVQLPKNFTKIEANFKWYGIKEQLILPKILNDLNLDLVHFPHFNIPIFYRGKFVVTIHDLIHQHFAMRRATTRDPFTYWIKHFVYKKVFQLAVNKSEKVITVSKYVRDELEDKWSIPEDKSVITYEGVEEGILKISKSLNRNDVLECLRNLKVEAQYIFYVGNAHPHKNVEGLIRAFLDIRKKYQYLTLVLAGNDHYFWQRVKREFSDKDIKYLGYVSDEELVCLYKGAQVFVQPSFEEGFGIPPLEAMSCGCPVVSSNKASLPEVIKDAGLFFDPFNTWDMGEKIMQVLNDNKLRKRLIEKGNMRYKDFSWDNLAKQTLDIYKEVL